MECQDVDTKFKDIVSQICNPIFSLPVGMHKKSFCTIPYPPSPPPGVVVCVSSSRGVSKMLKFLT